MTRSFLLLVVLLGGGAPGSAPGGARGKPPEAGKKTRPARAPSPRPPCFKDIRCPDGYFCVVVEEGKPRVCKRGVDTVMPKRVKGTEHEPGPRPEGELLDSTPKQTPQPTPAPSPKTTPK